MTKLSRKETAAIVFMIVVFGGGLMWKLAQAARNASTPGVTLQEAFAQPPVGPPPGRPSTLDALRAGNTNAVPPDAAVSGSSAPAASIAASSAAPPSRTGAASAIPAASNAPVVHPPTPEVTEVVVHVAGAVHKPGVYHLMLGARNDDAIQKAGGPTSEANLDALNLAARVEDGSQLYLPTRKQHPEGGADAPTETASGQVIAAAPAASAHAVTKSGGKAGAHPSAAKLASAKSGKSGKLTNPSQGTVNINTASAEELQRIPGIGPAMAERILEFRQASGKFTAPEDLLQISGIGEKKFARMQPFVRVK